MASRLTRLTRRVAAQLPPAARPAEWLTSLREARCASSMTRARSRRELAKMLDFFVVAGNEGGASLWRSRRDLYRLLPTLVSLNQHTGGCAQNLHIIVAAQLHAVSVLSRLETHGEVDDCELLENLMTPSLLHSASMMVEHATAEQSLADIFGLLSKKYRIPNAWIINDGGTCDTPMAAGETTTRHFFRESCQLTFLPVRGSLEDDAARLRETEPCEVSADDST